MVGLIYKNIYIIREKIISMSIVGIGVVLIFELLLLSIKYGNLKELFPDSDSVKNSVLQPSYAISASMFLLPAVFFEIFGLDKSSGFGNFQYALPVCPKKKVAADYACFYGFMSVIFLVNMVAMTLYVKTIGTKISFYDFKILYLVFAAVLLVYCILIPAIYISPKGLAVVLGILYLGTGAYVMIDEGKTLADAGKKILSIKGKGVVVSFAAILVCIYLSYMLAVVFEKRRYRK